MNFRKIACCLVFATLSATILSAQQSAIFSVQSGISRNGYFYSNTSEQNVYSSSVDGTVAFFAAFTHNNYLLEIGATSIYSSTPHFVFNVENSSLKIVKASNGSVLDMVYLPFRFGYIISTPKKRITISPKIGIGLFHSLNGTGNTNIWADGVDDISLIISGNIPEEPGVTIGYGYNPYKNIFAIDASISLNYTLHKFLLLNFNLITVSALKPLYYENIKHFGETQTVYATSTQTGPAISATIGFAFTIPFTKEQEVEE